MSAEVRHVVREVVTDLLPGADVAFGDGPGVTVTVTVGGEVVCTAHADEGLPPSGIAEHVANVVQDAATERLGRAVPECPGHAHPAVARASRDGIEWSCPETGDVLPTRPRPGCGTLGG